MLASAVIIHLMADEYPAYLKAMDVFILLYLIWILTFIDKQRDELIIEKSAL